VGEEANGVIGSILSLAFLAQVAHPAARLALAAMGGALTERAGVIDLAIEAKLLFGAFTAVAVALATGSVALGIAGGMAAGVAVALVQVGCALWFEADQVIVGIALNLVALGGTRFLLKVLYGESSSSPDLAESHIEPLGSNLLGNPIVWICVVAAIAVPLALRRTRWGLRVRAAGDRPDALVAVGVSPRRTRVYAACLGGALAGAGGAHLSLSVGVFTGDMSQGRGYMALAMVILSGWRPAFAALACVGIALAEALSFKLQMGGIAAVRDLANILPYVLTLAVLVIWGGRHSKPPSSLGKL
jgi:simple sugar transport system permease protein